MDVDAAIDRLLTHLPSRSNIARGPVKVSGALIDVDTTTGKALKIERVMRIWGDDST
jgi:hypothetical protein